MTRYAGGVEIERVYADLRAGLPHVSQIQDDDLRRSIVALETRNVTLSLRPPSRHINYSTQAIDATWSIARFTASATDDKASRG